MRTGLLGLTMAFVLAGAVHAAQVGEMGPNFTFKKSWNVPEGFTQLEHYRGKVVMIERWATW